MTLKPIAFSIIPVLEAMIPFPIPLSTPPVTRTYFIVRACNTEHCCEMYNTENEDEAPKTATRKARAAQQYLVRRFEFGGPKWKIAPKNCAGEISKPKMVRSKVRVSRAGLCAVFFEEYIGRTPILQHNISGWWLPALPPRRHSRLYVSWCKGFKEGGFLGGLNHAHSWLEWLPLG